MSNDEPIVRPNLMHLDKPAGGEGKGHGGGGCGCGGHGEGAGHGRGHGEGKGEGGCGCGGHGHASRDYVVIEPVVAAEKVTQPEVVA
jgi:hypothetical protein